MAATPDIVHDFARAISQTRFENLPAAAIDSARKTILDTCGCILAGGGMETAVAGLMHMVRATGGQPESSVMGFGDKVPAAQAAFANGAMAHCLDFDDRTPWGSHSGSSLVPAAFALAERQGGVSGRQMIAAVAAGQDLFVRLRCNLGRHQDWNLSNVLGVLSAAATSAHIMGFDSERTAHALGVASMYCGGTMEIITSAGSNLRAIYAGFSAQGAVNACLLAAHGITGVATLFEGKAGLFNTYFEGKYDRAKMVDGLGKNYLGSGMLYKPWPCVGIAHTYVHATIQVMREHGLSADDIEHAEVFVGDYQQDMCEPLEKRRAPGNAADAKFSLPFAMALAIRNGDVAVADYTPSALKDPKVLATALKVVPVPDATANWTTKSPIGRVRIIARDGRAFERRGEGVPGSPEAPLTWDDLSAKFRGCARAAATPLSDWRIAAVTQMARDFDQLDDAARFVHAIATP